MVVQKDEFVDLTVNGCVKKFRQQYLKEYELINEFIKLFRICENEIETTGTTRKDLYLITCITQLNELFQSAIILLERGLKDSAYILIRSILELAIKIVEIVRNEGFIDTLSLKQNYEDKKVFNEIKKNKLFVMMPQEDVDNYIDICNKKINEKKEPKFTIKELAQKNGLNKEYVLYKLHCDYTHQTNFIIENKIKKIKGKYVIDGGFKLNDFNLSVAWLMCITSIIFPVIIEEYLKKDDIKKYFNDYLKKFEFTFSDIIKQIYL